MDGAIDSEEKQRDRDEWVTSEMDCEGRLSAKEVSTILKVLTVP